MQKAGKKAGRKKISAMTKTERTMASLDAKKLFAIGGCLAVVLPRVWAEVYATQIDGAYYVKLDVRDNGTLELSPIDENEFAEIMEVTK